MLFDFWFLIFQFHLQQHQQFKKILMYIDYSIHMIIRKFVFHSTIVSSGNLFLIHVHGYPRHTHVHGYPNKSSTTSRTIFTLIEHAKFHYIIPIQEQNIRSNPNTPTTSPTKLWYFFPQNFILSFLHKRMLQRLLKRLFQP